ncbi:MAG: hypothetical protein EOO41_02610 [Methanobacteriota archaeon]|nr:MAG: hypothetical protein EOO41_02610 [Euryarchaeota archaeon]
MQATGRIHFDLLFQITIVSASDFHAGSPLLEELRLSISLSLNINSLLVEVSVVSSPARMLGAAAAAPASLGRTHAAAAARRLTGTENVLRIRVSIITTVSLDINEIRDANEALQNRLLSKSLAELLSYFLSTL